MSCYHPMVGYYHGELTENGKKKLSFAYERGLDLNLLQINFPGSVLVPCGHCIGCRLDRSRRWADRMMLELASNDEKGVFVTLTYDCRHLKDSQGELLNECRQPSGKCDSSCPYHELCNLKRGSLYKKDFQDWMKRLRERLREKGVFIRFYACGEYGSWKNTHRPHYHAILFGVGIDDFGIIKQAAASEIGSVVYETELSNSTWIDGFSSVGCVSWASCAYVARYVQKKALDPASDLLNEKFNLNPEFSLMSRRPGLGAQFLLDNPDLFEYQSIVLSTPDGAKKISIPNFYIDQLGNENSSLFSPDFFDKIKKERMKYANDRMLQELSNQDLPLMDYLERKESVKLNSARSLKRSL